MVQWSPIVMQLAPEGDTTNELLRFAINVNGVDLNDWSSCLAKEALARDARHADERIREGLRQCLELGSRICIQHLRGSGSAFITYH